MTLRALLALSLLSATAVAKPMEPPTDEGAAASETIVTAEYLGRDATPTPKYFEGAVARYRVVTVHKGKLAGTFRLAYSFHDQSACVEEEGWKFTESMMPRPGSRWILFIQGREGPSYYTYRGGAGRWPLTNDNIAKLKALLPEK